MSKPRRAALYARFSTDLQRDASIDDQLRSCCSYAAKQGIEVVEMYSDRAVSGAGLMRSGIQKMLRDAQAGCFDIVVSEAMDRLLQTQFGCSTVRNKGKELYANMNTISQADLE